jgi:hypothetical protein
MDIPAQLRCLFAATVEERDDSYVIEVPAQELRLGDLQQGEIVTDGDCVTQFYGVGH